MHTVKTKLEKQSAQFGDVSNLLIKSGSRIDRTKSDVLWLFLYRVFHIYLFIVHFVRTKYEDIKSRH